MTQSKARFPRYGPVVQERREFPPALVSSTRLELSVDGLPQIPVTAAVSFVTLLWRNERWASTFVASLQASLAGAPQVGAELVMVVNGPEGEAALIEAERTMVPQANLTVRTRILPHNTGFAGGANAGTAVAEGDVVVVVNLDVRFPPTFVPRLMEAIEEHPDYDFVVPSVYRWDPESPAPVFDTVSGLEVDLGPCRRNWAHNCQPLQVTSPEPVAVAAGTGCCLVMRRRVIERREQRYGEFLESRFHSYAEDVDLFWWAEQNGLRVMHVPGLFLWHVGGGSSGGSPSLRARPAEMRRQVIANWRVTVWKHAQGARQALGWAAGEVGYLALLLSCRPLGGWADYLRSWRQSVALAVAIRRARGFLRDV
jgi:GT2 family glycosyltransferase